MENMEEKIAKLEKTVTSFVEYTRGVNTSIITVLEGMNARLHKIEGSISVIETKINILDGTTNQGFVKVDDTLAELKTELQKINNVTGYDDIFKNSKSLGGKA